MGRNHSYVEYVTPEKMAAADTGKLEVQYEPELDEGIMAVVNAHPSDKWDSVRTFPGTVEFVLPGLNKSVGLRRYAERNGIPVNEILAIGDMDNDTAMIEAAGWGVCMANGCDASKAVADAVTEYGVDEDGFGRYFEDHWFNR